MDSATFLTSALAFALAFLLVHNGKILRLFTAAQPQSCRKGIFSVYIRSPAAIGGIPLNVSDVTGCGIEGGYPYCIWRSR